VCSHHGFKIHRYTTEMESKLSLVLLGTNRPRVNTIGYRNKYGALNDNDILVVKIGGNAR